MRNDNENPAQAAINAAFPAPARPQAVSSAPRAHLFAYASVLRHIKSGGVYVIVLEPDLLRLEASAEPAYGYRALGGDGSLTGPLWARAQTEMEDGRFALVSEHARPSDPLDAKVVRALDPRTPDLWSMLRLSSSRYEATYTSEGDQRMAQWDCSGYLCANYALAEFWEIVEDKAGSFLTDSLREDPDAPQWVRDAPEGLGRLTVRAVC